MRGEEEEGEEGVGRGEEISVGGEKKGGGGGKTEKEGKS